MEHVHPDSSPRLDMDARIFLNLSQNLTGPLVTSSISRFAQLIQFFKVIHKGKFSQKKTCKTIVQVESIIR